MEYPRIKTVFYLLIFFGNTCFCYNFPSEMIIALFKMHPLQFFVFMRFLNAWSSIQCDFVIFSLPESSSENSIFCNFLPDNTVCSKLLSNFSFECFFRSFSCIYFSSGTLPFSTEFFVFEHEIFPFFIFDDCKCVFQISVICIFEFSSFSNICSSYFLSELEFDGNGWIIDFLIGIIHGYFKIGNWCSEFPGIE